VRLEAAVDLYRVHLALLGRKHRLEGLRLFLELCRQRRRSRLEDLGRRDLESFAGWLEQRGKRRLGRPYAAQTRRLCFDHVRGWLAYCLEEGLLLADLAPALPRPRVPRRVPRVPEPDQLEALLDWPSRTTPNGLRQRALWELAYGTGLRLRELIALDLEDVDAAGGWVLVRAGKGGCERMVPVGESALAAVGRYRIEGRARQETDDSPPALWLSRDGARLHPQSAILELRRASRALGFPVSMHALRHACATHLLRAGAPVRVVQELLGHAELRTTQRYTHVDVTDLRRMLARCHPRG